MNDYEKKQLDDLYRRVVALEQNLAYLMGRLKLEPKP